MKHRPLIAITAAAAAVLGCSGPQPEEVAGTPPPETAPERPARRAMPGVESGPQQAFLRECEQALEALRLKTEWAERIATFEKADDVLRDARFLGREIAATRMTVDALRDQPGTTIEQRRAELEQEIEALQAGMDGLVPRVEELKPTKPTQPAELPELGEEPPSVPTAPK